MNTSTSRAAKRAGLREQEPPVRTSVHVARNCPVADTAPHRTPTNSRRPINTPSGLGRSVRWEDVPEHGKRPGPTTYRTREQGERLLTDRELLRWIAGLGGQRRLVEATRIICDEDIGVAQVAWRVGLNIEVIEALVRVDALNTFRLAA